VMVLDMLKGAAATAWPMLDRTPQGWQGHYFPDNPAPDWVTMSLVGIVAAVLGHSFSMFTKFRGGKGVATAAGGLFVLIPVACAVAGATWVVIFYAFRYVSLASILAAGAVIAASWLLPYPLAIRIIATLLGGFVIFRHHTNIHRLLSGTESKFVKKPPAQP
jgi:glycerol-3-phosphate acyltransferase PlsY